jgi:type IV secretion system protein TrbL
MSLPIEPGIKAVLGWFGGKVGSAAANVALAPINALASGIADAVGQLLATLGTLWIRLNVPNVWTGDTTSGVVQMLHSEVAPLAGLLAVLGIIIGAARLAWQQTAQTGVELLEGLFIMVVVTGMGVPMIATLVSGADAWSESIIENGTAGTDFGRNITAMLSLGGPTLAPVLAIFFGILALLVSITQIGLLVFRAAALVLLAGLLPVAAALAMIPGGREQLKRYIAWVIALIAYKPVASLIYLAAIHLVGAHDLTGSGAGSILIGLSLMVMALLALPALLRFLVPATAALHAGSPAAATRTAAMQMPTGARRAVAFTHPAATLAVSAGQAAATGVRTATGAATGARNAPTRQENTHP